VKDFLTKDSNEFGTPLEIFQPLHRRYVFTVDAAASKENALLLNYWTKEDDALSKSWACERVWCNPPYSKMPDGKRGYVEAFCRKAFTETGENHCQLAVLLVPTKSEQAWYGELKNSGRVFIQHFKGRIKFNGGEGTARDSHMLITIYPPLDFLH